MAEKKEIIIEVEVDNDKALKRTEALKKRMQEQKEAVDATKKAIKALDQESATYADDLKRLTSEQLAQENALKRTTREFNIHNKILQSNGNSVELLQAQNAKYNDALKRVDQSTERGRKLFNDLTNAIAANNEKIKDATRAAKGEVSEYAKLQGKLTSLKNEYRDLAAAQAQGAKLTKDQIKRMRELEAQISETDGALKEIDATMGQFNRNVGNYKNAINEAIQENQGLFASFGGAGGGADDMAGQLGNLGKALMGLVANPLGALIAILATLVAAFGQTAGGASMFKDIMGGVGQMFNKVTGDIGKLAEKVLEFFSYLAKDPVGALKSVGDAIKDNLISRFEGLTKIIPAMSAILKNLLTGNFDDAAKSATDLGNAVFQTATGVEDLTGKITDYASELGEAYDQGVKYTQVQREIEKQNRALIVSQAKLTGALEMSRATMNDDTLGWKARKKAADESFAAAEKLAVVEKALANNNLKIIQMKIAARKAEKLSITELQDEEAQALAASIQANNNYDMTMRDLSEERRKMARDAMESQLDALIDGADNAKTIAEQQVADGRVDAEARKKLLSDLVAAERISNTERIAMLNGFDVAQRQSMEEREALLARSREDFAKSSESFIALIEAQEKKQIDFDALLKASSTEEQARIMKELDLSEIAQTRLLEIVKERKTAEQDYTVAANALLDERIATQKAKLTQQVADEQMLLQLRADNEVNGNAAKLALLDSQMAAELVKYQNNEAMKAEITKKYEIQKANLKKELQAQELQATANILGEAASLFEENTIAYKVLATGQAIINTYMAATAALASGSQINPIFGQISAAAAIATGLLSVAKINGVKFADGGKLEGKSHAEGGIPFSIGGRVGFEAEGGEYIINKRSTAASGDAIATINANPGTRYAAVPFASGGAVSTAPVMARAEASDIQNQFNRKNPIVVTVEDIKRAFGRVEVQDRRTTF